MYRVKARENSGHWQVFKDARRENTQPTNSKKKKKKKHLLHTYHLSYTGVWVT